MVLSKHKLTMHFFFCMHACMHASPYMFEVEVVTLRMFSTHTNHDRNPSVYKQQFLCKTTIYESMKYGISVKAWMVIQYDTHSKFRRFPQRSPLSLECWNKSNINFPFIFKPGSYYIGSRIVKTAINFEYCSVYPS